MTDARASFRSIGGSACRLLQVLLVSSALSLPGLAPSAWAGSAIEQLPDAAAVANHFRGLGYRLRGGVDRATAEQIAAAGHTFPTFSSSFTVGNTVYPFTMIGDRPESGRTTTVSSVIIPLRMNFSGFGPQHDISYTFEPGRAVHNMLGSPLYQSAVYPAGFAGQFVDQMQRAAFWNRMGPNRDWHILMGAPQVLRPVDIEVSPVIGQLQSDSNGNLFGNVHIDFMDAEIQTILQFLELPPDVLPIFVTDNVTADALGYHNAAAQTDQDGAHVLQTYIYTSWLDPAVVPPIFADVSTFNHELAEWTNDPFGNNIVPAWDYPPPSDPNAVCAHNPYLEVGDPQGNGPTYVDFPAANITIAGVTYHLQQLVLWEWFTDQVPSTAYGGWFTFPIPSSLTVPAVYCK
jgi:hypothetical protein